MDKYILLHGTEIIGSSDSIEELQKTITMEQLLGGNLTIFAKHGELSLELKTTTTAKKPRARRSGKAKDVTPVPPSAVNDTKVRSEAMPEVSSEAIPEEMPEISSEAIPEVLSEAIPEVSSEVMPEEMPEVSSEVMPEEMPEASSEVMPEVLSEVIPESESIDSLEDIFNGTAQKSDLDINTQIVDLEEDIENDKDESNASNIITNDIFGDI